MLNMTQIYAVSITPDAVYFYVHEITKIQF